MQEVLKSELDLFKSIPFQASVEKSQYVEYRPLAPVLPPSFAPIEFIITSPSDDYVDLRETYIVATIKIVGSAGGNLPDTANDKYCPVSNILHSMFRQVDLYLGDTLVSQSSDIYPYRAYLDILLNAHHLAKKTWLQAGGFEKDKSGSMNAIQDRKKYYNESKKVSLAGKLHLDIAQQDKLILNALPIKIVLTKSSDSFSLLADTTVVQGATLQLEDIALFVRRVHVAPGILTAHQKALQQSRAKYPIVRVEVKVFSLTSGQSTFTIDNAWLGQLPRKVVIGFVDSNAYVGDYTKNPFNFANFKLNYLVCTVNGEMVPVKPYQPDYENSIYGREYFNLYLNTCQTHGGDVATTITFDEFKDGYALYAFDLSQDQSLGCGDGYVNITKRGTLKIDVHFKNSLANPLKAVCYAEFDNVIEIDSNREVTTDY
jgi:hypothetical protein